MLVASADRSNDMDANACFSLALTVVLIRADSSDGQKIIGMQNVALWHYNAHER